MPTAAQIKANQENSKLSTGPTSQAGAERSSQNALRHGYTGQTLVLTPDEAEAYAAHVATYMERHQPLLAEHRQLVQQLADSDWGAHQIFTSQTAQISLLNTLTLQLTEAGADVAFIIKSSAQCARTLATLTSYENRKRRTSKAIEERLRELYQQMIDELEAGKSNETKPEPEIGFVHPEAPKPPAKTDILLTAEQMEAYIAHRQTGLTREEALNLMKM